MASVSLELEENMLLEAVISEIIERDKLRSMLVRHTYCLPAVRKKKKVHYSDFFFPKNYPVALLKN